MADPANNDSLLTGATPAEYNPIFEKLAGPEQLQGLVAYGLYKIAKREWVREFCEREGRSPAPAEMKAYVTTWTPTQLSNIRERAAQVLAEYANSIIQAEEPRVLRRALKGTFWRAVWPSLFASFLYTLILIGTAMVLARSGIDLLGILRSAVQE